MAKKPARHKPSKEVVQRATRKYGEALDRAAPLFSQWAARFFWASYRRTIHLRKGGSPRAPMPEAGEEDDLDRAAWLLATLGLDPAELDKMLRPPFLFMNPRADQPVQAFVEMLSGRRRTTEKMLLVEAASHIWFREGAPFLSDDGFRMVVPGPDPGDPPVDFEDACLVAASCDLESFWLAQGYTKQMLREIAAAGKRLPLDAQVFAKQIQRLEKARPDR